MKKTKAISVTVPYELVSDMEKISKKELTSISSIVSDAVKMYCVKKRFEDMRSEFSKRAAKKGIVTEKDIETVLSAMKVALPQAGFAR